MNGDGDALPKEMRTTAENYYKYIPLTFFSNEKILSAFKIILNDKKNLAVEKLII